VKIKLYWPNCYLAIKGVNFNGEDAIFLECSVDEAKEYLFDRLSEDQVQLCLRDYDYHPNSMQLKYGIETNKICFLITRDQKVILPVSWYFPYAGQWNAYNPFLRINEIEIKDLGELSEVTLEVEE
jgi:hypothetical protein